MNRESDSGARQGKPKPAARRRDVPVGAPVLPPDGTAEVGRSSAEDTRHRRRTLRTLVIAIGIVLVVAIPAFGIWSVLVRAQTHVEAGKPVQLEIPSGANTKTIAGRLLEAGVIDNAAMFRLRARIDGIDSKLRPGIYDLRTGMAYREVVDRLTAGPSVAYVTITIPEGFTIEQIAERVGKATGLSANEFGQTALTEGTSFAEDFPFLKGVATGSLEGYLFPKTYRVAKDATVREVIAVMLRQFGKEIEAVDLSYAENKNLTLHDVVTIASMVEREARVAEERPLVSSVIYNRLRKNMRLEIDATIEYILPGTRPRLLNQHLKIDSPYNSYMYGGLPPGPIASPGLASLEAAAHPAETGYLYYVLTSKDGSHTFTKTLEEFLIAKEKSREVVP